MIKCIVKNRLLIKYKKNILINYAHNIDSIKKNLKSTVEHFKNFILSSGIARIVKMNSRALDSI